MGRLWSEESKYGAWLRVELAVCDAYTRRGRIPPDAMARIRRTARVDIARILAIQERVKHEMIALLTSLEEQLGPDSRFVHIGLTTSDVWDTALALQLRDAADLLLAGQARLQDALRALALRHKDTLTVGRTHGVHAEPTSFGLKAAVWYTEAQRNLERLRRARQAVAVGKLSGAVGTFAHGEPELEAEVCRELGLEAALDDPAGLSALPHDVHRRGARGGPGTDGREPRAEPRARLLAAGAAEAHGDGARPPGRVRDRPASRDARLEGAAAVLRAARGRPGGDGTDRERRAEGLLRPGVVPPERGRHLPAGRADSMSTRRAPVNVETREKLYEGKAKIVYATDHPELIVQYFKDDATAFNALKRGTIVGKGVVNNRMSAAMFARLERAKVPTHYLGTLSDREMLCRRLDIIKIETIVRNVVAGSLAKRTGLEEGTPIGQPIVELYYKSDPLGDPMINDDHVRMMKLATPAELAWIRRMALRINRVLRPHLLRRGLLLVDFKLEFGRAGGRRYLGDEISPDTCRLWDRKTREKLDKDRFRRDLGGVEEAYQEVYRRLVDPTAPGSRTSLQ